MDIEQRLEALAQSMELLASLHKDNEARMEKLIAAVSRIGERESRLENIVTQIAEGTVRLMNAVESHEQRISDLEEGNRNPQ